jgi:hypothetical protein
MSENIKRYLPVGAIGSHLRSRAGNAAGGQRRPGVKRPSPRAVNNVLVWINEAQSTQRRWARNALIVVCLVGTVLCLAVRFGLLRA